MARIMPLAAALALSVSAASAADSLPPESGPYAGWLPDTSLSTTTETPPDTDLVQRLFALAFTEECGAALDGGYGGPEPEVFDLSYVDSYDPAGEERPFRLYQFNCFGGAYNLNSVFYGWDGVSGLRPISFAVPNVDVEYESRAGGDGDEDDSKVAAITIAGVGARLLLSNAEVHAAEAVIESVGYWRGIGDASSRGEWVLRDGAFSLQRYEVDASYDGEVNPLAVVDYNAR